MSFVISCEFSEPFVKSFESQKNIASLYVAGKSLLLPRWQGQSAVGVQPRRDEGLSRQPQKVVFASKPQLLSWQQHRAGAWPWLPATTSCSWRSATTTSPLRDGDLATTTPLASEDSIIWCGINLVMFPARWCFFVLATRVSLIAGLPPRLTSFWFSSAQISSKYPNFPEMSSNSLSNVPFPSSQAASNWNLFNILTQ